MEPTPAVPDYAAENAELKARLGEVLAKLSEVLAKLDEVLADNARLKELVSYYERQLLDAKRRQFGVSSERTLLGDVNQITLFGNPEEVPKPPEPELEEVTYTRKKRKGKREEDLAGLPMERVDYELDEAERVCPECGEVMRDIGVKVRRELKLIPAKVVVLEHAAHSYACKKCQKEGIHTPITQAKAPAPLISGSLASPSLVAHIAVQKYQNGLPIYRLENGFKYDGVAISRQAMCGWLIYCSEHYFYGLYRLLIKYLLQESVLHTDETENQVLREPGRAAQTKSYEWIWRSSGHSKHKIVIYEYRETRNREHVAAFLEGFKGYLHNDGLNIYHGPLPGITVVGCWYHARRYWEKIYKSLDKEKRKGSDTERGMLYFKALSDLEVKFKDLPPDERYKRRLEESKPIADDFFAWLERLGVLPKMLLGEAVNYALSQRKYLENVFLDGRLELSNNRAERTVKRFIMGRKAWLFANSPAGADASSVIYSLIETAVENGLNPYNYLKFLLETLPGSVTSDLKALLPWSHSLPDWCRV